MMTEDVENNESVNTPPKIITWLISCAFFMQMIDGTILNTALPDIAKNINEKPLEMQSVVIAYMLTVAFFLPISGWLAGRIGAKKVFISAMAIFTIGSLLCSLSGNLVQLVLSRIVQGVGGALMVPTGRLIVLKEYPKDQLLKVLSFIMLPALFGPIMGPPLGGFFVEYFSWHWIFLINIPIGIFSIILTQIYMPEIEKEEGKKFDWLGFFYLSTSIVLICIASNKSDIFNMTLGCRFTMIGISIALITRFWFHIKKSDKPLIHPKLKEIKSFSIGIVGNLGSRLGFSAMPLLLPLMLQVALGVSPSKSGLLMLTVGLASIAGKFLVEKLVALMGYRRLLVANTIMVGVAICCFVLIDKNSSDFSIIALLFLMGVINSIQFTTMNTVTLIDLPKKYAGDGNSLLSIVMQIAMVLGISIGSSILNVCEGMFGTNLVKAFHTTFIILGVFTVLSSVTFNFIPKDTGVVKKKSVLPTTEAIASKLEILPEVHANK